MEDSSSKKIDAVVQTRRLSIIDVSSEDDSLLGLAPGFIQDDASSESQEQKSVELFVSVDGTELEELFEPVDPNKLDNVGDNREADELVLQPCESLEPERIRKNSKYNLRKSLAWDSAFLTCEGVLDAEELSSMISVEKGKKKMLPGIQEEVHRSTDSISTLGSDTLTLESVETNLFEDVRASIQRSSRAIAMAGESSKGGSGLKQTLVASGENALIMFSFDRTKQGLKKMDLASQHKSKPKVASKKPSISMQNPGKLTKPVSACPQSSKHVAPSGVSTLSLLKQPKVLDKPIPSTTRVAKRASMGGNLLKVEKDNMKTAAGRGAPIPKLPGSLRSVPRPSKSSSLASSTGSATGPTSSAESSGSTASVKFGKSPPNSMKRKTDSRTGNPNSSGSNPKTPSRVSSGNKLESGKSRLSAQFVPSTKLSSSISPASSISDWSSESVSSISSLQQISCSSRDSISRSSCKRVSIDFDTARSMDYQSQTDDQSKSSVGPATRVRGLKASTGMVSVPPSSKPSGLRLPSPKIGFFDGVKSAVRTPKRCIQSNPAIPSNLPKASAGSVSPRKSAIKSKLGKVNPERAVTLDTKPDAQRTSSNSKPKISPLPEASKATKTEISSELGNPESQPATSPKAKSNTPFKFDLKAEEAGTGGDDIGVQGKDTVFSPDDGSAADLKAEVKPEVKRNGHKEDVKFTPVGKEGASDLSSVPNLGKPTSALEVVADAKNGEVELKTTLHSIRSNCKKEKPHSEDQIDCLIREISEMEIKGSDDTVFHDTLTYYQPLSNEDNLCVLSKPIISTSPTTNENPSCTRIPFSVKDSLCNIGGSFDASKGSTASEREKNSQLPSSDEHFEREQQMT